MLRTEGRGPVDGEQRVTHSALQLPDVALPARRTQQLQRSGLQLERPLAVLGDEVAHEQRDILEAIAQRGELHLELGQAGVQILAERAVLHLGAEIAVRGAGDAELDPLVASRAHRPDDAVFEHTQQLGLAPGAQLADLVQKKRAARGRPEQPAGVVGGAREGALDVTEQLALEDRLRDSRAVDRNEGALTPTGALVQKTRGDVLARSGAPLEQDDQIAVSGAQQLLPYPEQGRSPNEPLVTGGVLAVRGGRTTSQEAEEGGPYTHDLPALKTRALRAATVDGHAVGAAAVGDHPVPLLEGEPRVLLGHLDAVEADAADLVAANLYWFLGPQRIKAHLGRTTQREKCKQSRRSQLGLRPLDVLRPPCIGLLPHPPPQTSQNHLPSRAPRH